MHESCVVIKYLSEKIDLTFKMSEVHESWLGKGNEMYTQETQ